MRQLVVSFIETGAAKAPVPDTQIDWEMRSAAGGTVVASGVAQPLVAGKLTIDIDETTLPIAPLTVGDRFGFLWFSLRTVTEELKVTFKASQAAQPMLVTKVCKFPGGGGAPPPIVPVVVVPPPVVGYDLANNNSRDFDWLVWETEGNSDPKYQRGGRTRQLGLYKLNYDKLRKAGTGAWRGPHPDHTIGGGWVKVAVLDSVDYSSHAELINTFLPCFQILGGKVKEPPEIPPPIAAPVARHGAAVGGVNAIDMNRWLVMPFNYDDNGPSSNAIGKDLAVDLFAKVDAARLDRQLTRWATASRSTITAFPVPPANLAPAVDNVWALRPDDEEARGDFITGPIGGRTLKEYQADVANVTHKYYSVKTGVQFVSTVNQSRNKKDLLEENSIHAMNRSNLIVEVMRKYGAAAFEGTYQVEILCILLYKSPDTKTKVDANPDGLLNTEKTKPAYVDRQAIAAALSAFSAGRTAKWEPTRLDLVVLQAQLKAIDVNDAGAQLTKEGEIAALKKNAWRDLKANADDQRELLAIEGRIAEIEAKKLIQRAGLDFVAAPTIQEIRDAANLEEFRGHVNRLVGELEGKNREAEATRQLAIDGDKAKLGFDGIQIREIADAGGHEIWFPALAIPTHGKAFAQHWGGCDPATDAWIDFWERNYAIPMGRAKGEMLLYFGMQHMTSNAQNFLVAFDRTPGTGASKLILRDIGDTLYNDHVFETLKEVGPIWKKEWDHESGDPEFGVTLQSALGSYTMPRMTRIGASIVFLFAPFVKGDVASHPQSAQLLARWCTAHNLAFLQYMRERVGYTDDWSNDGAAVGANNPMELLVATCAELKKENDKKIEQFVPWVLGLKPSERHALIAKYALGCDSVTDQAACMRLVNAHDVAVCAEVQSYLQSPRGVNALRALHGIPPVAVPVVVVAAGPPCAKCGAVHAAGVTGWYKCLACGLDFCSACTERMPKPPGMRSALYVGVYQCPGAGCKGIAEQQ